MAVSNAYSLQLGPGRKDRCWMTSLRESIESLHNATPAIVIAFQQGATRISDYSKVVG